MRGTMYGDQAGTHVADLAFVQAGIGDGVAHGHVAVGRCVAHETLELAVHLRVQVDLDLAADLAAQAGFGVVGQGDDAGAAVTQGAGDGIQIVAKAGRDAHAGNDDTTHQKLSVEVNRPTRRSLAV